MSKVVKRRWRNEVTSELPRKDRASCDYEAYIPDPLVEGQVKLDGDVAADVADAERAIAQFDTRATTLADTEALARLHHFSPFSLPSLVAHIDFQAMRLGWLRCFAARSQPCCWLQAG